MLISDLDNLALKMMMMMMIIIFFERLLSMNSYHHGIARSVCSGWRSRTPEMKVNYELIDQAVADSRLVVIFQFEGLACG